MADVKADGLQGLVAGRGGELGRKGAVMADLKAGGPAKVNSRPGRAAGGQLDALLGRLTSAARADRRKAACRAAVDGPAR